MTFEVFFNLIFDILGGGKDIAVFMRELFDQILEPPDKADARLHRTGKVLDLSSNLL